MAMPHHIGTFFEPGDFSRIQENFHLWVWTFRFHMFGKVVSVLALVALGSLLAEQEARVVLWPGLAVAVAGIFVGALGAAFYYHHGAWGALDLQGRPPAEASQFVQALRIDTEYASCLVRFGRVFSGLGLSVAGWGLMRWKILPVWVGVPAMLLGLAAIALTMLLPDQMSLYQPIFHLHALWLAATGVALLRGRLSLAD